jgi:2,3-diketo-5-methylthiopentyl-1-phosphate enolase
LDELYDRSITFNIGESVDLDKYVLALYYQENADTIDHISTIESSYSETSTGTWVHVPGWEDVKEKFSTKVISAFQVPSREDPSIKKAVVLAAFPIDLVGCNLPMLLSGAVGNITTINGMYRLGDFIFPKSFVKETFKGPKFGVSGIRELLDVPKRPLALAMVKPKAGLPADAVAKVCYELAMGGVDMIKDDEMTSDSTPRHREERLSKVMEALDKAKDETGRKVLFTVNVTDRVDRIVEIAEKCVQQGANAIMLNAFATGITGLQALSEDPSVNVPILAHPCTSGMIYRASTGMDNALLQKLLRLCGADLSIVITAWGKLRSYPVEEYVRACITLLAPLYDIKPAWPAPGGGVYPGMAPSIVQEFGYDVIIAAGGPYAGHPQGPRAGARAFRQAIDAIMTETPLEDAAKQHPELKDALDLWGIHRRPVQKFFDPKKSAAAEASAGKVIHAR